MTFQSYLYAECDPTGKRTREALNRGQLASSMLSLLWNFGSTHVDLEEAEDMRCARNAGSQNAVGGGGLAPSNQTFWDARKPSSPVNVDLLRALTPTLQQGGRR